ncbi:MFS transporter [Alcaligenes nematophilus]|uniref:MFS transporter n=1 Tax=Alcaligenes nematophilus TaxID=2994643 RepID=UPI00384BF45A
MSSSHSSLSPRQVLLAILALAVGGFSIGTGEFVIMGLLPDVAQDLGIDIPTAGHLISAYALGVVIGAPVLAVLGARWPWRRLLIALMGAYAVGNFLTVIAPSYETVLITRFLAGFPHGTYFGVAALVAARLVPPHRRAQAVAYVMLGLTVATLLGVPIATTLGQWLSWQAAFTFVSLIALLTMGLVLRFVPFIPANTLASPLRELGALKRKQVWLTLGIGAIGFGGMFSVFSYVKSTLMELAGLSVSAIPVVLALFGVGMVLGNLLGARYADRYLDRSIRLVLIWAIGVLLLFMITAHHPILGPLNIMLIGTLVALGPALQIRLMDVAGDAQTLAAALNHSAFNMANALGAWLGGLTIAAGWGWTSTAWVGALLALGGLALHTISLRIKE